MKYKLLIFILFFSFLNAEYLIYEDKTNKKTIEYIKKNKNTIFAKTERVSLAATQSTVWLQISLNNNLTNDTFQYIRFREAFLHKIILFDNNKILKGGSTISLKNRQLSYVTDTFKIKVPSNSSKNIFVKITPKYNATYAYDIFTSQNELMLYNSFFENVFIVYLSIMSLILVSAIIIFMIFKEKLFAYYIFFVISTIIFQLFQSGYILTLFDFPNIVKYDEIFALSLLIGSALFLKELFKKQIHKYSFIKYIFRTILSISLFGIILLLLSFNYYVDLLVELVIINFGLSSLIFFVLFMAYKKIKYSLFALTGMFLFINTSLYCALYYIGIIDSSYALVTMQIGSIIESFAFLSLILFRIYNHILEEKNKSEKYALKLNEMQLLAKMGTWTFDVNKNQFSFDKASKEIFEFNNNIISFEDFLNVIHPEDKYNISILKKEVLSKQNKNEYFYRIITKSGILKYISVHWQFSYNKQNILSFINGYILDTTEKTLTEENLKKQQLLLLHQQKLAQQGELLNMIAHQWRQPLTAVSATANALILNNMLGKEINSNYLSNELKLISEYTEYLSSTIDDFRCFFKLEKEKTLSSLEELVEKSLNIIKLSIESNGIEIVKNYNSKKSVTTYTNEVQQVILNLLKNAEDVLIERKIKEKKIFIETKHNSEYILLSINDNASGIKDEFMDKVFEPYFSTKKNKDGTGLGLYMSKTIINKHCSGDLSVKNNENGAIFTVQIPLD